MPVHNADVAQVFESIADLLEIDGENPFRIRAYRNAARTVNGLGRDLAAMLEAGEDLTRLPGIGADLAARIREVVETGSSGLLESLRSGHPPELAALLTVPGLGPRRVRFLHEALHVDTLEQLYQAAQQGRIRALPGFGEKTEQHILEAVKAHLERPHRVKLAVAAQYAEALVDYLRRGPGVGEVVVAGSYRRMRETVGDLDILVTATAAPPGACSHAPATSGSHSSATSGSHASATSGSHAPATSGSHASATAVAAIPAAGVIMDHFIRYDEVAEVLSHGPTRSSVRLNSDLQVDLRLVGDESLGAALHYFTGSKAHNIAIRRLAQERGLKINEYGVFRGDARIAGETEASVFATVDLPYIPPELREDRGEIEAARAGRLPRLVRLEDLRGDLHAHTTASDGRDSLREMALAARAAGLEYLAITDHTRHLTVARGLDPERLRRQIDEIDRLNETLSGITLLKGSEVDILEDGSLDLPDDVLSQLDLVVASVHSHFELPREAQTRRILRAMDHRHFTLFAHPSGRLIGEREAYDVDLYRVIHHAAGRGCYLELNANPDRLDLNDTYCRVAKDEGVLVSIDSDAHSTLSFRNLRFGVSQARRGWLEAADVLNTRPLVELRPLLRRTM